MYYYSSDYCYLFLDFTIEFENSSAQCWRIRSRICCRGTLGIMSVVSVEMLSVLVFGKVCFNIIVIFLFLYSLLLELLYSLINYVVNLLEFCYGVAFWGFYYVRSCAIWTWICYVYVCLLSVSSWCSRSIMRLSFSSVWLGYSIVMHYHFGSFYCDS